MGFHSKNIDNLSPVATGNWGCGIFRGNPRLKSLIQLMACTAANRDMAYFTFHNNDLMKDISEMYTFLADNNVTVGAYIFIYLLQFLENSCNIICINFFL